MTVSIKSIIHSYAATLDRKFAHDRSKTVGASEIGSCARKTWFSKHNAPRDEGYVESWGATLRGRVIEDAFWVPALRAELPEGMSLLFSGDEQHTLEKGFLSATTDGLLVSTAIGLCINLDCKSIDPRSDISKEKSSHHFQVQAQMGLIRDCTEYKPDSSILSYIDASFFDKITEFVIPFNPHIYAAAHVRAEQIMTASDALELPPEGKMAGGGECQWCAWASHCAVVTVLGVPRSETVLDDERHQQLAHLVANYRYQAAVKDEAATEYAKASEEIKQFLRDNNTRRYTGDGWSVSYSVVSGRATLDIAAIEASGFDLDPYRKTGTATERLTIR